MLRSNNTWITGPTAHAEQKDSSHHQIYKPAAFNYQQPCRGIKENVIESGQQYRRTVHHTEGNEAEVKAASTRLLSICNKYQRTDVYAHREAYLDGVALKDSKQLNRYNNPELKKSIEGVGSGTLQRSFSFINKDLEDSKTKSQIDKPLDLKGSEGVSSEVKTEIRKTSSFGLVDDTNKYNIIYTKKSINPDSKYCINSRDLKSSTNNQETKNRTVSEYKQVNRTTIISKNVPSQFNVKSHEGIAYANPDDQRIQSIDKINIKIKEILKCLNENEGKSQTSNNKDNRQVVQQNNIVQQRVHTRQLENNNRSSEAPRSDEEKRSLIYEYGRKKDQYRRISTQTDEAASKYIYPHQRNDNSKGSVVNKYQNIHKTLTKNKDEKEDRRQTNPRDIDFEIKKIEQKIKKSEEEKIKLNIRFDDIAVKSDLQNTQFRAESKGVIAKNISYRQPTKHQKDNMQPQKSTTNQKMAMINSQTFKSHENHRVYVTKDSQFGVIRQNDRNSRQHEQIPRAEPLSFKLIPVQCEIKEEEESVTARESQRFIDILREQVRLDEELRNAKVCLQNESGIQEKFTQIQSMLSKSGIQFDLEKIKTQFQSTLEQHNPFYTTREGTVDSIHTLVHKYISAKQHWQKNIIKCFNGRQLKEQNFTQVRLDLQRKGHLTVEDFVRFLNIETGTFFRNRDLILIFRRLTKTESVTFDEMMRAIIKG